MRELLDHAWKARELAYAPYSKFRVGAAILSESGAIFTGCNVENVSFGLTICGERSAIFSAISAGERKFIALAIVASTATPIVPCGACRQVLAEFSPSLPIFSEGDLRSPVQRNLCDLLPLPSAGIFEGPR